MNAVQFVPSDVRPFFPDSAFQNTEKEIMAAQIVTYLAQNGNDWEAVVNVEGFFEHTQKEHENVHPIYHNPFANPILSQGCVNAVWKLVEEGYIVWVTERKSFKVTDKLVDFYGGYVS